MEYLGCMLSLVGLSMADYNVKAIQEWPELWKVKDIQPFLRFAKVYWRFIFNYSEITILLMGLTRNWNVENLLKCSKKPAPLLQY